MFFGCARTLFVNKNVRWKFHHQYDKMKEVYCNGTTSYGLIKQEFYWDIPNLLSQVKSWLACEKNKPSTHILLQ